MDQSESDVFAQMAERSVRTDSPNEAAMRLIAMRDMLAVFDAFLVFASIIAIGTMVITGLP
jgi:hypothetical protein